MMLKNILIVEDEPLIALHTEDMVRELGYTVSGNVSSVVDALTCLDREEIELVLLDYMLETTPSVDIVNRVDELCIPYICTTGYDVSTLAENYPNMQILIKPYTQNALKSAIDQHFNALQN